MDIEVGGQQYRIGKLDTFRQFHVGRRLGPLLSGLATMGEKPVMEAISDALASMSDAECNYVFHACLPVVARQQGTSYAPVYVGGSTQGTEPVVLGRIMFADIDISCMLQLTAAVVKENVADFFSAVVAFMESMNPTTA